MEYWVLISPLAKGAYFAEYREVCLAEFSAVLAEFPAEAASRGGMDFVVTETQLPAGDVARKVERLSFAQGLFVRRDGGLEPVEDAPSYPYPPEIVFASKYQGKTNELVTQLALNLAFAYHDGNERPRSLLDPLAGRGTTLLWALLYDLDARGIEIDAKARELFHGQVKKQCKLHRVKHGSLQGKIGNDKGTRGQFTRFTFGERRLTLATGDTADVGALAQGTRFDFIVTDLPYGIQHRRQGNPLAIVEKAAAGWVAALKRNGTAVLIFNNYRSSRRDLIALFESNGMASQDFAARHRMSESIMRDLLVFKKT